MENLKKSDFHYYVDEALLAEANFELVDRLFKEEKINIQKKLPTTFSEGYQVIFIGSRNIASLKNLKSKIIIGAKDFITANETTIKIDFNSVDDINALILSLKDLEMRSLLRQKVAQSDKVIELVKKNSIESIDLNIYQSFIELEKCLIRENSKNNWNEAFLEFVKKNPTFKEIQFFEKDNLLNALMNQEITSDPNQLVFKVYDELTFLSVKIKNNDRENENESYLLIELLLNTVLRSFNSFDERLIKQDGEIDIWKKAFSKIPKPMCIISKFGDLLVYNESYAKLGILPKECLGLHDFEKLEINKEFFKIRRINFEVEKSSVTHFIFYSLEENKSDEQERMSTNKASVDELGIISSSIAHELNNPLAGILAAISLLELEDYWDDDALLDIRDMKASTKRCKELVEIFLGFSRFSPSAGLKLSIKSSQDQAINLLRFRMIESNMRLEIDHVASFESFSHQVNASVMSMIFYLIFSELMTSYSHQTLVSQNMHGILKGEILELSNQIIIRLEEDFEFQQKIEQSKLVEHLLAFEKLEMKISRREIKIISRL